MKQRRYPKNLEARLRQTGRPIHMPDGRIYIGRYKTLRNGDGRYYCPFCRISRADVSGISDHIRAQHAMRADRCGFLVSIDQPSSFLDENGLPIPVHPGIPTRPDDDLPTGLAVLPRRRPRLAWDWRQQRYIVAGHETLYEVR